MIEVMFVSMSSHIIIEIMIFNADIKIKKTFLLLIAIKINIIDEKINITLVPPKNRRYELTVETTSFIYGELCKIIREIFTQIKLIRNIA